MGEQPPKEKWLRVYTWVLVANLIYILMFYLLTISL